MFVVLVATKAYLVDNHVVYIFNKEGVLSDIPNHRVSFFLLLFNVSHEQIVLPIHLLFDYQPIS